MKPKKKINFILKKAPFNQTLSKRFFLFLFVWLMDLNNIQRGTKLSKNRRQIHFQLNQIPNSSDRNWQILTFSGVIPLIFCPG